MSLILIQLKGLEMQQLQYLIDLFEDLKHTVVRHYRSRVSENEVKDTLIESVDIGIKKLEDILNKLKEES